MKRYHKHVCHVAKWNTGLWILEPGSGGFLPKIGNRKQRSEKFLWKGNYPINAIRILSMKTYLLLEGNKRWLQCKPGRLRETKGWNPFHCFWTIWESGEGTPFHSFEKTQIRTHFHWIFVQHGWGRTCRFVLHKHVKGNSPHRAGVRGGALVLGHGGAAEGVQHDRPLVGGAWDEDIVEGPVVLIQAVVPGLPPAEASSDLFSIGREKDIHKSARQWWGNTSQMSQASKRFTARDTILWVSLCMLTRW